MASILFQEADLIKKIESLKKEFDHFDNFSHVIIPKLFALVDGDCDKVLGVKDLV